MPDPKPLLEFAFDAWLDDGMPPTATIGDECCPYRELLERVSRCSHRLPVLYQVELGLPVGATYGAAAAKLLGR